MSAAFELRQSGQGLELWAPHHPRYGAVRADWGSAEVQRRVAGGRRQLLARAIGLHKDPGLRVLDATAGLGRDGYLLAALGAQVTLVERHPVVAELLRDALARIGTDPVAARIALEQAQARDVMARGGWDVIYLDPMYPGEDRTALAKKEMQFLRELTGGDADADALLAPALAHARRRVVVKRPLKAPPLAGQAPAHVLRGSQARFDLYPTSSGLPKIPS